MTKQTKSPIAAMKKVSAKPAEPKFTKQSKVPPKTKQPPAFNQQDIRATAMQSIKDTPVVSDADTSFNKPPSINSVDEQVVQPSAVVHTITVAPGTPPTREDGMPMPNYRPPLSSPPVAYQSKAPANKIVKWSDIVKPKT